MAKTVSDTPPDIPPESSEEELKRQKKQARREAKLMLEIEEAKKDLKKAQKKQVKAEALLEERSTSLYTLETRLAELRASSSQVESEVNAQGAMDEQMEEEATPPEDTVAVSDVADGEAMQENETAVKRAPAARTPRKTSALKPVAARTSTATTRPASRSQRNRKPSSETGQDG